MIYTIVTSVGAYFHSVNESKEDKENKTRYRNSDGMTYIDSKGRNRLLLNDDIVFYTNNKDGDYIIKDANGNVYKNFSEEKRIQDCYERKRIALENGETTYCHDDNNHCKDWKCKGKRFKDFETGEVYIIRYIKYKYYYMNISNGMIVRKTDWQIKQDEKIKDAKSYLKDLDIEDFNKKQKNVKNKQMLYRNFEYNSFCDIYK